MVLPQDYINYVKLVWSDSAGIEHTIYPISKTSNPIAVNQDPSGDIIEEILTNNGFDSDLSDWTVMSNTNTPAQQVRGNASSPAYAWNANGYIDADAGLYKKIYQSSTSILAGHTYRVSYDLTLVQGSIQVILIADDGTATKATYRSGQVQNTVGSYTVTQDITVNATSTATWAIGMWNTNKNFTFDSRHADDNFVGTIDNVPCYDLK